METLARNELIRTNFLTMISINLFIIAKRYLPIGTYGLLGKNSMKLY